MISGGASEAILKDARRCRYQREALRELAGRLPVDDRDLDLLVGEAVRARDELAFRHILLSALDANRAVDARHLAGGAALVEDPVQLGIAALRCRGDVAAALVSAVEAGGMGWEREATALLLAGHWCSQAEERNAPRSFVAHARRLARIRDAHPSVPMQLLSLAGILEDSELQSVLSWFDSPVTRDAARFLFEKLVKECSSSVLAAVPAAAEPRLLSGYTVRRAVARVGRNEPCPCGSGKKYKKCCHASDQERLGDSSDVPGVTMQELRESPEDHLTEARLLEMRSYELARLDPTRVATELHPMLLSRLIHYEESEPLVRFFEEIGCPKELEAYWEDAIYNLPEWGEPDLVRRLVELRPDFGPKEHEKLRLTARLALCESDLGPYLQMIDREALSALRSGESAEVVQLAYDLLSSRCPGLGILVARGALPFSGALDTHYLLETLLETRDKLRLPPEDPIEELVEQRVLGEIETEASSQEESRELAETRRRLNEKIADTRRLETEVAELHDTLERLQGEDAAPADLHEPVRPGPEPVAEGMLQELRRKLTALKKDLKSRHAERNLLRHELARAKEDIQALRSAGAEETPSGGRGASPEQEEEAHLLAAESVAKQPLRLPRFPARFAADLEELPGEVARAALRIVGRLSAGDLAAFRSARRLKLAREFLRHRFAGSYRLIFRLHPDTLEVVTVIHRRDLERTIRGLAAGG